MTDQDLPKRNLPSVHELHWGTVKIVRGTGTDFHMKSQQYKTFRILGAYKHTETRTKQRREEVFRGSVEDWSWYDALETLPAGTYRIQLLGGPANLVKTSFEVECTKKETNG